MTTTLDQAAFRARQFRASSRIALVGALLFGPALPAFAQATATPAPAPAPAAATGDDDIIVTGFRRSLETAIATKRDSDLVVESISAEDIGKLPDNSIAESLSRLPGLASQRLAGRSQVISIRGFAPDFSTTLLNGREQTSTGDNRAVEYDQYPSEVISQVNVYKTPFAALIGQGLSGTVDLRTVRPLDYGKQVVSFGFRGEWNDLGQLNEGSKSSGYRINGSYVDQFADDTIGVALAASYISSPYQIQEFNAWGYAGFPGGSVIGGAKPYVTSSVLERFGLQAAVQWKPTEQFAASFDFFYSNFKDDQIKRGIELPLGFQAFGTVFDQANSTAVDGFYEEGVFNTVEGVVRNDVFQREADLYSGGLNLAWRGDNGLNITGDISYSRTDRNELIVESNAGTGRGQGVGATDTIGFMSGTKGTTFTHQLDYSNPDLIFLTSPLGWGGTQIDPDGPDQLNGQDGYYNNRIIEDELWQFRGDVEQEVEWTGFRSVQVGFNYTTRDKQLTPDEAFLSLVANTDGLTNVRIPDQYLKTPTNLEYLGLGPVISYDPLELLDDGFYNLVPNQYQDVVTKGYLVEEDVLNLYAQANLEREFDFARFTGNFGVQAIRTKQSSDGFASRYVGNNPDGSPNIQTVPITDGASYWDVLPSVNLALRFPNDTVARFGYAKEIARPRMDDLRVAKQFNVNDVEGIITGSGGNTQLRPWRADAIDLTFEKYFGGKGYAAVQFFYKDLKTYIYNADVFFDFSDAGIIPPDVDIEPIARLTLPFNGEGGSLYGVEVAGTIPFEIFAPALEGFGATGGASFTESNLAPAPGAPEGDIPGYSKWVANGTVYYEKSGFSARTSVRYRSSFVGELSGFGAVRTRRRALGETILDFQIGYEFQTDSKLNGLALYFQGENLTDEPFVTVNPQDDRQVIDYQTYGRRFLAGFTYKFR